MIHLVVLVVNCFEVTIIVISDYYLFGILELGNDAVCLQKISECS